MGFLDDLKKDADEARRQDEEEQRLRIERERVYVETMQPIMLQAFAYLRELSAHLALLPDAVVTRFVFPVLGLIGDLRQHNYRLNVDSAARPTHVRLGFDAHASHMSRTPLDPADVEEIDTFLSAQRIRSVTWPTTVGGKKRIMFEAQPGVHATLEIVADIGSSRIVVEVNNFRQPGHQRIPFPLEVAATEQWRDTLGGFVLGKVESLVPRRVLSEHERLMLQSSLDEAHERHRIAARETELAASAPATTGLKGLVTRLVPGLLKKS